MGVAQRPNTALRQIATTVDGLPELEITTAAAAAELGRSATWSLPLARWIDMNALTPDERFRHWVEQQLSAFHDLVGCSVIRWAATEWPMREQGPNGLPAYQDPAVPYLQVNSVYFALEHVGHRQIATCMNTDTWGLCLDVLYGWPDEDPDSSTYTRTRQLWELPVGTIQSTTQRLDADGNIAEVCIVVAGNRITFLSAEVYEDSDGSLRIGPADESILIRVL